MSVTDQADQGLSVLDYEFQKKSVIFPTLQLYSASIPILDLQMAGNFDFANKNLCIGLGKAKVHTLAFDKVGILSGVDAGLRFTPTNNSSLHYKYNGPYAKLFLGLGVAL